MTRTGAMSANDPKRTSVTWLRATTFSGRARGRMTIGIQMNHWHPLGIRHAGREGQRDLALVGQLSSALVFGDHEEAETTKENPSLRPHRR